MSQTSNQPQPWEDDEPWSDDEQDWGGEDEEEMRLGGLSGRMSFWDALVEELGRQRCGRA